MFGTMRLARRPPGWRPLGPPPTGPRDVPRLWPRPGEDSCFLCGDWRILQRVDGHRWSLDDLVTAWVAGEALQTQPPRHIADLGCGIGAVLLLLAWRFRDATLVGVEAQRLSVELARRSVEWNGVHDRCSVRLGDLRDAAVLPERRRFDLVTATPPYLPLGAATKSRRVQCAPCRFEHRGGIEAYCHSAARALAPQGTFVTCAGAGQSARVHAAAALAGLSIVQRLGVIPRAGKAPLFANYVMRRGDRLGEATVDTTLVVRDRYGGRTDEFRQLRHAMGMPP